MKRKSTWDWIAMGAGVVATFVAVGTAASTEWKLWFAIPAAVAGATAAFASFRSKQIDDRTKAEKAESERQDKENQRRALEQASQGTRTITLRVVRLVLDALKAEFFPDSTAEDKYTLRATLFKCVTDSEGQQRLIVFARAGANEVSARTWAVVADVPEQCEGIAGYVWCTETIYCVESPVEWDDNAPPEIKQKYASKLRMTLVAAEASKTKCVALSGTVVQVAGEKWGVLILDSRKKGHLKDIPTQTGRLERYARLLGRILREGQA